MRKFSIIILLLIKAALPKMLLAQSYDLHLQASPQDTLALHHLGKTPKSFSNPAAILSYVQALPVQLQEQGFLTASIDEITPEEKGYSAVIYVGSQYKWASLNLDNLPVAMLVSAGIDRRQYDNQPLRPSRLANLTGKLLSWADENGYPFSSVYLDQIAIGVDGSIKANLQMKLGEMRRIDSVIVEGDAEIQPSFLYQYLEISPGMLYNEKKLSAISTRLKELQYLEEEKPWTISFRKYDTHLKLYLKERPANQLNAIVGLQPNTGSTDKFLLTVDVQVALQNILSHGEALSFSVQQLQARSPRINLDALWPSLFGTSIGAEGHFNLYKQDSLYQKVNLQAGIRYTLSTYSTLRAYYESHSNNVRYIDTQYIRNFRRLPDNNATQSSGIGMEVNLNQTDYRLNPRRGWNLQMNGAFLRRNIIRNDAVTNLQDGSGFNYAALYDSLDARSNQFQIKTVAEKYTPLSRQSVLKTAYHGGYISGSNLFLSELFQIGGFKLLRGFDEQSIFASQYHIITIEPRLLLDQNSYVFAYSDNAWVQADFNKQSREGYYFGFGAGATLQTKTGQFTIGYGLGKSTKSAVRLRESKIYLGYIAFF